MAIAVVVIANDFSAINVALPTMEKDFSTNINTIQWVVNAYALTFGVMIVTGGRLADMFGRRRAFFLGTAIFASMSALGGAAQTESWLIASRVLMGIGGALMWPAILGMTYELLPEERAGLAGGVIIGAAGLGNAMGPLIGGVLTDALSWRWIFFLNVPISVFAVVVTWFLVKIEEPEAGGQRIDYGGIAALSVGLVSLLIALDQVDDWGWTDPRVIGLLAVAALLVAAFVPIERRAGKNALVPSEVMRNESFRASCLAILFMSATFFAALLYLPQFMQKQLDYSPLEAGVGMLPFLATFAVVSFVAGPLYERLADRRHGRARPRDRQLLPDRDDRRGHLGRRIADQPGRRHRLHVSDRGRLDRPWTDDDRLLLGDPAVRRRRPGSIPAGCVALTGRLPDRALLRRRTAHCSRRFSPHPPLRLSVPAPPRRTSSPRPPKSASLPLPPSRVSSPSRPISLSAPSPPLSLSGPEPPTSVSRPGPPRMDTGIRTSGATLAWSSPPSALNSKAATCGAWQTSSFGVAGGCSQTVPPTSSG
jgi:MFS family permease